MPVTSYIRNNDYLPQQFKPYNLPYNAMIQAASTRNQYFLQSLSTMQSAWKRIDGLDPQNITNKNNLKGLRDQYEKDFQKVANSDLTVQGNQNKFKEIADSLYDTSDPIKNSILKDHSTNEFFKKQAALSEKERNMNGGKNWNSDNDFFWKSSYADYQSWAENGDPNNIDKIEKREFIPYYDYRKELKDVMDLCHEDSLKTQSVNSSNYMLFDNFSKTSLSEAKAQSCLSLLSPQAKQQIGIGSFKQYYNNHKGLLSDYKSYFVDKSKSDMDALNTKYAAALLYKGKDPKKLSEISELKQLRDNAVSKYNESIEQWSSIIGNSSEEDYVNNNYKNLSFLVGNLKFTERAAKTLSWYEIENKLTQNAAGIVQFNAIKENLQEQVRFANAQKLAEQKQGYEQSNIILRGKIDLMKEGTKLKVNSDGTFSVEDGEDPSEYLPLGLTPIPEENSYLKFMEEKGKIFNLLKENAASIISNIESIYKNNPNLTDEQKIALSKYDKTSDNYTQLLNFINVYDRLGINEPIINSTLENFRTNLKKYRNIEIREVIHNKELAKYSQQAVIVKLPTGKEVMFTDDEFKSLKKGNKVKGYTKFDFTDGALNYSEQTAITNNNKFERARDLEYQKDFEFGTKYYTYIPIKNKDKDEEKTILSRLNLPLDGTYSYTRMGRDRHGNIVTQITKKTDDGTVTLDEDEMKSLNSVKENVSIEYFSDETKKGGKSAFFKISNFKNALPDYLDGEINRDLSAYVTAYLPEKIGWLDKDKVKPFLISGKEGKEFSVQIGSIKNHEGDIVPIFKISQYTNNGLVENPMTFYSIEEVLALTSR